MSETREAGLRSAWLRTLGSSVAITSFNFLGSIFIARGLSVDERGVLASYQLLMVFFGGLAQMGLGQAFVYASRADGSFAARNNFILSLLLVLGSACLFLLGYIEMVGFERESAVIFIGVVTFSLYSFLLAVMQVFPKLEKFNLVGALCALLYFLFVVIYYLVGKFEVYWIFVGQVVIYLVLLLPMLRWGRERFSGIAAEGGKAFSGFSGLFRVGFGFYGVSVIGILLTNIDKGFIYFKGAMEVMGLYVVAFTTTRLISVFQNTISTVLYSRFAGTADHALEKAVSFSFRVTFAPLLLASAAASQVAEQLIGIVYGESYAEAAPIFAILLFEAVLGGASWVLAQYFNSVGRSGAVLLRQVISVVPILAILPFIPDEYLGVGLAAVLLLAAFVRLMVTLLMYRYMFGLPVPALLPTLADARLVLGALKRKSVQ